MKRRSMVDQAVRELSLLLEAFDWDHRCPPAVQSVKFWRSCSGCYESEDGHPNPYAPTHPEHNCKVGLGCDECGGSGVVLHDEWVPYTSDDSGRCMLDD